MEGFAVPRIARRYQIKQSLVFHVLNRGVIKQTIFHIEEDYRAFLSIIKRYMKKLDAAIYHYCLMPNHFHLVMEFLDPSLLSKLIGGIQQVYAMRYHRCYDTAGRLFQNRFKSQAIHKETYMLRCGRYVEMNPVRAHLCENAWDWPWSSAKYYVLGQDDGITTRDPLLSKMSSDDYRRWLTEIDRDDEKLFRSGSQIIGPESFKKNLYRRKGRMIYGRHGRRR